MTTLELRTALPPRKCEMNLNFLEKKINKNFLLAPNPAFRYISDILALFLRPLSPLSHCQVGGCRFYQGRKFLIKLQFFSSPLNLFVPTEYYCRISKFKLQF